MVGSSLRLPPRGSRQRQREFGIEEESNWPVPLGCREIRVESRCEVGRLFLYPCGDHDYYYCRYPIIYVITLGAKAELEHALEHSAGEQRTTDDDDDDDDTRVGRVLCAGWRNSRVLLVVRARSLARSPGSGRRTAHASTNRGYAAY